MEFLALCSLVARATLLVAGLLAPGAALMWAMRAPCTVATSFAGSVVAQYVTVLALQLSGVPIALGSMVAGFGLLAGVACVLGSRWRPNRGPEAEVPAEADTMEIKSTWGSALRAVRRRPGEGGAGLGRRANRRLELRPPRRGSPTLQSFSSPASPLLTALQILFWSLVLWRAWNEPLAGPDIEFRWGFLAEQLLRLGSLDFYPPRSAADFQEYFWAESIPPGVATLHAWAFACAGTAAAGWTVPTVVLQLWSIHELAIRTAARLGGARAAGFATLGLIACPLLTWSVLLGQETGLTALACVGIAFGLAQWDPARSVRSAALVGAFAILGAAAREYGLVFPLLAAFGLAMVKADRRAWLAWGAWAAVALAWPFRTWLLTGNPFYSLPLANFPVNARFVAWIHHEATALGASLRTAEGWATMARYLLLYAPLAWVGWIVAGVACRRHRLAWWPIGTVAAVLGLWAMSVRYTHGGLFYSLRVVAPALVLGVVATGIAMARFSQLRPRQVRLVVIVLAVIALSTLPSTLALPVSPWRTPWALWPVFAKRAAPPLGTADETVALVVGDAGEKPGDFVVLADGPGFQRRFAPTGIRVVPLWSPGVDWLCDPALPRAEVIRQWRASQVRYVILTKWQSHLDFFNLHTRGGGAAFQLQTVGETGATLVLKLQEIE